MDKVLQKKYSNLQRILKELGRVVVAYSGGVDSTFLLKVAADTVGPDNVLACIGTSPSLARTQYNRAIELAGFIGVEVCEVPLDELSDDRYAANEADRCYHCKSHLFEKLAHIASEKGFRCILCGSNLDDDKDFRPGRRAFGAYGVRCPLAEAGLTKDDVRQLSSQLRLPTADLPASPCLASRINYGLRITEERLKQVEAAEEFLQTLGLVEFRLRHHDMVARIEVHPEDIQRVVTEPNRTRIVEKLKSLGFKFVAVDLQGFRSGSLNEALSTQEKQAWG